MQNWEVTPKTSWSSYFKHLIECPISALFLDFDFLTFTISTSSLALNLYFLSMTLLPKALMKSLLMRIWYWPFITCSIPEITFALFILLRPINNGLYQVRDFGFPFCFCFEIIALSYQNLTLYQSTQREFMEYVRGKKLCIFGIQRHTWKIIDIQYIFAE